MLQLVFSIPERMPRKKNQNCYLYYEKIIISRQKNKQKGIDREGGMMGRI